MKRVLAIAIVMVLGLSLMASATGIVINIGFSPMPDTALSMGLGYRVADWSFLAQKEDFSMFEGTWNFGFFWEKAGYKVGPVLQFDWTAPTYTNGVIDNPDDAGIAYKDLMFVVGLKQAFAEGDILSSAMYAQLEFSTSSAIGLEIGFELEFNMLDLAAETVDPSW